MLNTLIRARSAAVVTTATTARERSSSDETLVARIADGDRFAMEVLFARHRTHVYRWLLRFVSDETLAEDLLSDVFLDVWRQAGRFEFRSSVSTWLLSIARYKALSARRRRRGAELDDEIDPSIGSLPDIANLRTADFGLRNRCRRMSYISASAAGLRRRRACWRDAAGPQ
jgi:DNA-directed RNA polymerase specialized sigma24 family protein